MNDYTTIRNELAKYDEALAKKDEIIIFTKSDMVDEKTLKEKIKSMAKHTKGKESFAVTIYDDASIKALSDGLVKYLNK